MPGQPQWTGPPPQPVFNAGYPPQDPMYPPQDPMYPPAQPPQSNGPPPNQPHRVGSPTSNPVAPLTTNSNSRVGSPTSTPVAPLTTNSRRGQPNQYPGYAPVMYSAPSGKVEIKMENMSPADPLLAHPPPQASSPFAPAYQFNIDTGKNATTNFL
ncbi:unnamed protein product [Coregonus sp. 'balchen']|nr:unnamed protein product [Coregonus sp. 'balchen']